MYKRQGPDRRAVQLRILPAGNAVVRRAPGPMNGVLPEALAALDAQTLARLDKDLGQVIKVLGAGKRGAGILLSQP